MLRRASALVALIAVAAAPAFASTRLFCRYTGAEMVDCDEAAAPAEAQVRGNRCCERRTFGALAQTRPAADDRLQAAPLLAPTLAPAIAQRNATGAPAIGCTEGKAAAAGPPAFLSHRALLL